MPNRSFPALQTIASVSVVVGLVVLALKYFAYVITGSVALYSDALESIVNVATAVAALVAIRFSAKPADANHPYGHHKAEYFSVILEGVLIVIAALSIFREAYFAFFDPRTLTDPARGLIVRQWRILTFVSSVIREARARSKTSGWQSPVP